MGQFTTSQGLGGMSQDIDGAKSPAEVLEFALNAVYDDISGARGSVHTEGGTEIQLQSRYLFSGTFYYHVGHVDLTPNKKVLFLVSTDGINGTTNVKDAIAYFEKGKVTLIRVFTGVERMNFDTKYPIRGVGRIRRGTNEVVYWCDGFNPDRYLIVNRLSLFENGGVFNPSLTLFNKRFTPANIELMRGNDSGGSFELGAYRLAIQYEDSLGNTTETFHVSNTFFAVRGDYSNIDSSIEGGYNILSENHALRTDAYNPVTKSFTFKFNNIDIDYSKLIVYALKYTDGNQTLVSTHLVKEFVINNRTEIIWTFRGIEASHPTISTSELTKSLARYENSKYMIHIQNILIKGNLTEKPYDWAKFQKYVTNTAKVKYVVEDIAIDNSENNNKRAKGGFYNKSAVRDEIQTIGVRILLIDGTVSPVFIVPGRPAIFAGGTYTIGSKTYDPNTQGTAVRHIRNTVPFNESWDKQILTVKGDARGGVGGMFPIAAETVNNNTEVSISNVPHLGVTIGETVERWQVYNTAIEDIPAETEPGYIQSGIMGFYETDTTYPEIRDSDGDLVFPNTGGVMHNIRHHKFPTSTCAPIYSNTTAGNIYDVPFIDSEVGNHIHTMGVKVFGLEFPPEYVNEIVGVKFYFGDRTNDKTVVDKGFWITRSNKRKWGSDDYLQGSSTLGFDGFTPNPQYNRIQFHSSKFDVGNNDYNLAGYISIEREHVVNSFHTTPQSGEDIYNSFSGGGRILGAGTKPSDMDDTDVLLQYTNRGISRFVVHGFNNQLDYSNYPPYFNTQRELGIDTVAGQGVLPPNPPESLLIPDNRVFSYLKTLTGLPNVVGYGFLSDRTFYGALKSAIVPFDNLAAINFMPANDVWETLTTDYAVKGNDTYIVQNFMMATMGRFVNVIDSTGGVTSRARKLSYVYNYWTESDINYDLRHGGTDTYEEFYPSRNDIDYFTKVGTDAMFHNTEIRPEYIQMNPDMAILDHPQPGSLFDLTIDYSSLQLGKFPVRVAWSGKSQDEELTDLNLSFAALDYDDLSTNVGEIRMLAQKPNMLYAMTDYSVFAKPANAQSIELSGSTAFLKQSSFLDIPETKLYDTGSGFGGCQHRFASVDTEFGTLYVNQLSGEIYLLNKELIPLSNKGLSTRLYDIIPSTFLREFERVTGITYPFYDTTLNSHSGLGVRCYYDPIWKRGIITKIDYEFKKTFGGLKPAGVVPPNIIYWDSEVSKFYADGAYRRLYEDSTYFHRRYFTLSYDFKEQKWASFHSWIPKVGLNDTMNLYTMHYGGGTSTYWHKHVLHNYLQYYESPRSPFILEFNTTNFERATINQINWLSRCSAWSDTHNRYLPIKDETFNKIIVYTDFHTTGLLNMISGQTNPFAWIGIGNDTRVIKNNNHVWKVNNLWDMRSVSASVEPAMTEDINNASYSAEFYNGIISGYIDKVPNTASYDLTKSLYTIAPIDNEYITTRLIYHNINQNHKLSVDLISLFKQQDLI